MPEIGSLVWQRYGSGHVHGILLDEHPLASFERDALHRETRRTQGPASHHFGYGANGLLAAHRWQNLDERGRSLERPRPWRAWEYDAAGQLTTLDDAWRDKKAYRYDALSRLTHVTAASGAEAFHYDPAGNLLGAAPSLNGMQAWKANGDRLLRFAPQARPDRPVDFTYDGHGNRIARTVPLPPKPELTVAEQRSQRGTDNLLRVMEVLTGTPKYEAPTEEPEVVRYRYDGSHQLIAIEHADGARSEYEYDALGRRVAKHHTQAGGARRTTLFMWDGDWMMQEVRSGRTSHEDRAVTYVPHPDHEGPLTRLAEGAAWHYVTDHLGTPQELYDEQREVVWAADLSAYGRTARRLAHAVDNPIRFPGQYYDGESGLHYNRFRYYDPMVGRYINQDPIGIKGGMNFYIYVKNPINWTDYLGLQATGPVLLGMGHLYRSDIFPTMPRVIQNSSMSGVLGEVSNFPWPAPQLPGEWSGVNAPWTLPETYCASGYYGDDPLSDFQPTDNSGWSCKSRMKTNGQSFSVRGWDERKFTCSKIKLVVR